MHIDITPNRQSLPRFFISCNSVATHRAPTKKIEKQNVMYYSNLASERDKNPTEILQVTSVVQNRRK